MTTTPDQTLQLASDVAKDLSELGVEPLLIGALALAAHGYTRNTGDVDLAIATPPGYLAPLAARLERSDRILSLSPPDSSDPLGGVITIRREGSLPVQIVNFDNSPSGGFPALVRAAHREPTSPLETTSLRVVSPEILIFFKLYAGGPKSELDIMELLVRCPVDRAKLKALAEEFHMTPDLENLLSKVEPR